MNRLVRILVAWIIAIVLPAHGYASVTLALCEESGNTQTAALDSTADSHATHRHEGRPLDSKLVDVGINAGTDQGIHDAGDSDATADTTTHAACCGVSAFLPADFSRKLGPVPVQSTRFRIEAVRFSVVTLDGLDRPPRLPS